MDNNSLIKAFYESFANADAEKMISLYDDEVLFTDPVFGLLKGDEAKNMWRMLVNPNVKIVFSNIKTDLMRGSADWEATYVFTKTGRKVINTIHADFEFRNGKIVKHTDSFSFWKWSRQALGLPGYLLGWSTFLKNKVRKQALNRLKKFSKLTNG